MTVYTVYLSFISFVLLLLLIISYFLISLNRAKGKKNKIDNRKKEIKTLFINILEGKDLNKEKEIKKLKECLDKKIDIEAFSIVVKEYYETAEDKEEMVDLLEEVVDIYKILNSGIVRKEYKESYTLYLLSEFKLANKRVGEFALDLIESDSLYVRNNALNVINKNNDMNILMKSLEKINDKKHYFNEKMIIDFLDNYTGDQEELSKRLHPELDKYNVDLKKNIITHFTNMLHDSKEIRDKMISLIRDDNEKEVIIAVTKYFFRIIDERASFHILKNMDHDDWSIRAVSTRTISKYGNDEAKEKLKERLKDQNYYVRQNSANSFLELEDEKGVLEEALMNEDRFARDILLYAMNTKDIIGLEEYELLLDGNKTSELAEGVALI